MWKAIREGRLSALRRALEDGARPAQCLGIANKSSPIDQSLRHSGETALPLIQVLLDQGAPIQLNIRSMPCLFSARHRPVLDMLLDRGWNPCIEAYEAAAHALSSGWFALDRLLDRSPPKSDVPAMLFVAAIGGGATEQQMDAFQRYREDGDFAKRAAAQLARSLASVPTPSRRTMCFRSSAEGVANALFSGGLVSSEDLRATQQAAHPAVLEVSRKIDEHTLASKVSQPVAPTPRPRM